jgi:hypothetical protein
LQDDIALKTMVGVFSSLEAQTIGNDPLAMSILEEWVARNDAGDLDGLIYHGVRWSSTYAKRAKILFGLRRVKIPRRRKKQ